jgi:hypothetical protein
MRTGMQSLALRVGLLVICLLSSPILSQITEPKGFLHITSTPPGANILIKGNLRPELTDVTLVVYPGQYGVSVRGGPGNLNCPEKIFQVSAGQTVEVSCPPR